MAQLRMDHISVVVDDLERAIAFFLELGMEVEGRAPIEGEWVDRINGVADIRCDIVLLRTADGSGKLELTSFRNPHAVAPTPGNAVSYALGLRSVMFEVDDVYDMVERLRGHGASLIGEIVEYERQYRLCYLQGPAGIIVALAETLTE